MRITTKLTRCTGLYTSGLSECLEFGYKGILKYVVLSRYIGQKKYVELQSMLFDGAVLLFSHEQGASGTDLAKLYIDTLNEAESSPEEIHFIRISK